MVEELSYFVDVDFRMDSPGHSRSLAPHVTKQARLPTGGEIIFPLKHFDRANLALEGIKGELGDEGIAFEIPGLGDIDEAG